MSDSAKTSSTRPYLIRALHEWCCDNGLTPYITVAVDGTVQVPMEYVKGGEIVLNIGLDATTALKLGNDYVSFKARFSGAVREIVIPTEQVMTIFARENGQGMAFPPGERALQADVEQAASSASPTTSASAARPVLTRIK